MESLERPDLELRHRVGYGDTVSEPSVQRSRHCLLGARWHPDVQSLSWRAAGAYLFQGSRLQYRRRCYSKIQSLWSAAWFCLVAEFRPRQLTRGGGFAEICC